MSAAQETLVVVDGRVTDEKLAELLDLQTEQPELDFKRIISPGTTEGLVELAKDVGSMSVLGGYLVGGVNDHGVPTGEMDGCDAELFDEATLAPKLRKYLPEPVTISSRVTERDGHTVVLIYVAPHLTATRSSTPTASTGTRRRRMRSPSGLARRSGATAPAAFASRRRGWSRSSPVGLQQRRVSGSKNSR